jgi:hypothetical protein
MPAALPGSTAAENAANPSAGRPVLMDALAGPKGAPLDKDNTGNASTGALSTGIGYGLNVIVGAGLLYGTPPAGVNGGFVDDSGEGASGANSTLMYLGGGRSVTASGVNTAGVAGTSPYTAGFWPVAAGNGGSRDGGAGPAFTGFTHKMVTATAGVANGAAIETGFINRTGVALVSGQSAFGSSTTAQAAAS